MRRSDDMGKKALSVLMSAFLVAQMYFTPLQTAYAASGISAGGGLTQEQVISDNDGEKTVDEDEQAADEQATDEAVEQSADEQSAEPVADDQAADEADEQSVDDEKSDEADEQAADEQNPNTLSVENNALMLADALDSTETYNEGADYREVTAGISVGVYKDSSYSQEVTDSDSFTTDTTLYGKLNIDFSDAEKPTLSSPNIKYTFPKNVTFTNRAVQPLYDSNNKQAGTWYIQDGVAYLHYNEDWLRTNSNNITAHVSFDFTMAGNSQGDGKSVVVNFPGTATPVTIKTKDGSVDADKYGSDPSKSWQGATPTHDEDFGTYIYLDH